MKVRNRQSPLEFKLEKALVKACVAVYDDFAHDPETSKELNDDMAVIIHNRIVHFLSEHPAFSSDFFSNHWLEEINKHS